MEPTINLEKIFRLSPAQKKALAKLKLKTAEDILRYFPIKYGLASKVISVEMLKSGEEVTIYGKISKLETKKSFRSKIPYGEAFVEDHSGRVKCVWFNQPYIAKMFQDGDLVRIEGKVSNNKTFSNPKIEKVFEIPEGTEDSLFGNQKKGTREFSSLSPIYSETRGITSNWIYHSVQKILKMGIAENLKDSIPENILKKYNLPHLRVALFWIHAPKEKAMAEAARKRFAFEEIFFIQLDRQKEKLLAEKEKSFLISKTKKDLENFTNKFSFPLTRAQNRAIETILSDFKRGAPMSRLLEGDVGSGKTAVAAAATFAIVTTPPPKREFGNLQVAYMAPTEILAEQHFEYFIELFKDLNLPGRQAGIPIGLITGSGAKKFPSKINKSGWTKISKAQLLKWVEKGEIPILIGTHALIYKQVKFKNLGFIIIDEQHRFGVKQRMQLRKKPAGEAGKASILPHLLSMTATPIPRTLALTLFGDLDLSVLDELPPGRKPVETKIVLEHERNQIYEKIRSELKNGRQAYVICPRIDEADSTNEFTVQARSVAEEAKYLKKIFREFKIESLTGKMSAKEKDEIMRTFKEGKVDILVATSVVEVGVNVPNATVILIENAERFGLAQLHQLRGRVLRSSHKPYCFVSVESKSKKTLTRIQSFANSSNGFELAESDLKQRGAGDLAGAKQWGISDLAMEALKNIKMVEFAREEARSLLEKDLDLKNYPLFASRLSTKQEKLHME